MRSSSLVVVLSSGLAARLATAQPAGSIETSPASEQEVGAELGLEAGGRVSPGGILIGGRFLYQLAAEDWLDSGVGFTFGGGGAECFRDRDDTLVCDHALFDGFAAEAAIALRRYFTGQGQFVPFARVGVAVRVLSYGADDLRGLGIPLLVGGGVRATVAERVAVVGGAEVRAGLGWFGRGLGGEPQLSLTVDGGVEFGLQ